MPHSEGWHGVKGSFSDAGRRGTRMKGLGIKINNPSWLWAAVFVMGSDNYKCSSEFPKIKKWTLDRDWSEI